MTIKPNKFVQALEPYAMTPQDPWLMEDPETISKMDWNEGARPDPFLKELAIKILSRNEIYSWYPDCNSFLLNKALSNHLDIPEGNLLTFPGSDVGLETLFRTFIDPGDSVIVLTPTYEHVFVYISAVGGEVLKLSLPKPFIFDVDNLIAFIKEKSPKALYLVRPNNPCGYLIAEDDIVSVCEMFNDLLVIVDEAYIEFSGHNSMAKAVLEHKNLFVARTFSKAFCLAGMRIGYLVGNNEFLQYVARIRNGKNITMLAQLLAKEMLDRPWMLETNVKEVFEAKEWLYENFINHGIIFYRSYGNFVLFEVEQPKQIVADLKRKGIYIRDRSSSIPGCVRVSITNRNSTQNFWFSLSEILNLGGLESAQIQPQRII